MSARRLGLRLVGVTYVGQQLVEADVFAACGLRYIEPRDRNVRADVDAAALL